MSFLYSVSVLHGSAGYCPCRTSGPVLLTGQLVPKRDKHTRGQIWSVLNGWMLQERLKATEPRSQSGSICGFRFKQRSKSCSFLVSIQIGININYWTTVNSFVCLAI